MPISKKAKARACRQEKNKKLSPEKSTENFGRKLSANDKLLKNRTQR
uniref:Uncharacterized protein n=1 Tax=Rhizophora mucronata TaxID=61149 RepID=A0A2P2NPX9_RHIMU